jgi:hypothetical protein
MGQASSKADTCTGSVFVRQEKSIEDLITAAKNDDVKSVQGILDLRQLDVNTTDKCGKSTLHYALIRRAEQVSDQHNRVIMMLLGQEAGMYEREADGWPLHVAAELGDLELARALLENHFFDPLTLRNDGKTALRVARAKKNKEMDQLLSQAEETMMAEICRTLMSGGNYGRLKKALVAGIHVNQPFLTSKGTPQGKRSREWLIDRWESSLPSDAKMTALTYMASIGNTKAATMLLEHGANIDARDEGHRATLNNWGKTALHFAVLLAGERVGGGDIRATGFAPSDEVHYGTNNRIRSPWVKMVKLLLEGAAESASSAGAYSSGQGGVYEDTR